VIWDAGGCLVIQSAFRSLERAWGTRPAPSVERLRSQPPVVWRYCFYYRLEYWRGAGTSGMPTRHEQDFLIPSLRGYERHLVEVVVPQCLTDFTSRRPGERRSPTADDRPESIWDPERRGGLHLVVSRRPPHTAADWVLFDPTGGLVSIAITWEGSRGMSEFLWNRCLATVLTLRVIVLHSEETLPSVYKLVRRYTRNLFTAQPSIARAPSRKAISHLRDFDSPMMASTSSFSSGWFNRTRFLFRSS